MWWGQSPDSSDKIREMPLWWWIELRGGLYLMINGDECTTGLCNVSLVFRSSANKGKITIVNHIYASRQLEEPPVNTQGHKFPKLCPNTSLTHTLESENGCCYFSDSAPNYRQVKVKRYLAVNIICWFIHIFIQGDQFPFWCLVLSVWCWTISTFEFADLITTAEFWMNNKIENS